MSTPQDDKTQEDKIPQVTSATFSDFIKEGYTFIDFWADWCTPCKMVEPTIDVLAKSWKGKVKFGKLDTDNNPDVAMQFQILGIPTFILFKDGVPVGRMTGAAPAPMFTQFITTNYQGDAAA